MIPSVCANCEYGVPVTAEDGMVMGVLCKMLPVTIWKEGQDNCGTFKMVREPRVVLPEVQGELEGITVPDNEADQGAE